MGRKRKDTDLQPLVEALADDFGKVYPSAHGELHLSESLPFGNTVPLLELQPEKGRQFGRKAFFLSPAKCTLVLACFEQVLDTAALYQPGENAKATPAAKGTYSKAEVKNMLNEAVAEGVAAALKRHESLRTGK